MPRIEEKDTSTSWACPRDDTILRAALRQGLGFPYECNVGSCGNCRFELLEGEVEHLRANPPGLSERDRLRGRYLGCQARPITDCTVKVRLMAQYRSTILPARFSATLTDIRDITHDIHEFRFSLDRPAQFLPGQYALLSIPGVAGNRAYSMSNTGEPGKTWHFQVKRVPGGSATERLFEAVTGTRVGIDGPYGMAYLREDAPRDIVCVAGGSGLSPMISIACAAANSPKLAGRRLDFVYGGKTSYDICGLDMLENLPGFGTRIHYHPATSTADEDWKGRQGFVHEVTDDLLGANLASCEIYFAGPPAMAEAMQRVLHAHQVPPSQIHFDQFY